MRSRYHVGLAFRVPITAPGLGPRGKPLRTEPAQPDILALHRRHGGPYAPPAPGPRPRPGPARVGAATTADDGPGARRGRPDPNHRHIIHLLGVPAWPA
ncbi:hypothetical protein [Lysobacter gummosus]|uniref:hypothetical protein n=1 Tax=Lysobacter gummosus TaxID=262324 RepID=UPI00364535F9